MVSDGDRLYVTLGYNAPLSILDATTGELIKTVEGTEHTEHIRTLDGNVICLERSGVKGGVLG